MSFVMELTTYEASKKYPVSTAKLRRWLGKEWIRGRQVDIKKNTPVWLLDEASLKTFLKTKRKLGRPKKTS